MPFGHFFPRVACLRALPGKPLEGLLCGLAILQGFRRIVVLEVAEIEGDPGEEALGFGDGLGMLAEEARHLAGQLDVTLGVLFESAAGGRDGQVLADAGDDVLERTAAGLVIEHVVDRKHGDADTAGEIGETVETGAVVAIVGAGGCKPDPAGDASGESAERLLAAIEVGLIDMDDEELAVGEAFVLGGRLHFDDTVDVGRDHFMRWDVGEQVIEAEDAIALLGAKVAGGQQLAETAEGGAVGGIGEDVGGAVGEAKTRADDITESLSQASEVGVFAFAQIPEGGEGFDDAGEGVAVGETHAVEAERDGAGDELFAMRATAQEREISRHHELGIGRGRDGCAPVDRGIIDDEAAHAKNPWRYQRGSSASP